MNNTQPNSDAAAGTPRSEFRVPTSSLLGTALCNLWSAWGLLAAGLIVTVFASLWIKARVEAAAQLEFDFSCNDIRLNIDTRLDKAAQILRSGVALFDASEMVSREEWQTFTRRLQIERHLPGIQGIGFALLIPRGQLAEHVQAIRSEGFPDYQVKPAGEREIYSAIIYLEPFSGRNLRAFGYDMLSEPVRRVAMERARDGNIIALSGKVLLVQETDQNVQAGALMYCPIYRHGLPIETIEQRRAAIQGWVYSPYRMTDMIHGTLGSWDTKQDGRKIYMQVYDGTMLSPDTLLYDSQSAEDKAPASTAPVTRLIPVNFAGHCWTLRFSRPDGLVSLADYGSVWLVLFGGTIISLLLFSLMRSLVNTRANAQELRKDITKRKQAEHDLQVSETRYRQLFENAPDGILMLDGGTGEIVDVNPFLITLLGYTHAEYVGKRLWEIGLFKDIAASREAFFKLQKEEYARYENLPLETKDGRRIDVEVINNAYQTDSIKMVQCNIRDISDQTRAKQQEQAANLATHQLLMKTEQSRQVLLSIMEDRKLAEEALQRSNDKLEQRVIARTEELNQATQTAEKANRAKSEFLTCMSHELRTPLNAVIGFSQMLQEEYFGKLNEKQAEYVHDIIESGRHLLALITDILDLSKIESGRMSLEKDDCAVLELIEASLLMIKERAFTHHHKVQIDLSEAVRPLRLHADQRRLKQVLFNLLANAVKFTPDNGVITVSARVIDECESQVEGKVTEVEKSAGRPHSPVPALLVSVSDTGLGIPTEHQSKIFEEFYQAPNDQGLKNQGTGLGLPLSRRIVEMHGGRLWFESAGVGKGSCFRFTVPIRRDADGAS